MSFVIKPIEGLFKKDLDTFSKMDPYVIIFIGNRKYRSKTHKGGGKRPIWTDVFEIPAAGQFYMKVQAWDNDVIKDDFIGQGVYDLRHLLNLPGKTQNEYIEIKKHGLGVGRVLISMSYNGPSMNQGWGGNQNQQGWSQQANWSNPSNNPENSWGNSQKGGYNQGSLGYKQSTQNMGMGNQPDWNNQNKNPNTNWNNAQNQNCPQSNYPNNPYSKQGW